MKVAVFSAKPYDEHFLDLENSEFDHDLVFFKAHLAPETAGLAAGYPAICLFVGDIANAEVMQSLAAGGTRLIVLRCAGFNNVDLLSAEQHNITVLRVPAYSPHAVAEHAVGLMLALNRKLHRAYNHAREGNFSLEGLLGFDMHGRTVGIIGTGMIGSVIAGILKGFGCRLLAFDKYVNPACESIGVEYVSLSELYRQSDIITLHCPLLPETHHLIDDQALESMKDGVMIINTSRGAVVDTRAVIEALKTGKVGNLGLDVYEEEADLFFEDLSDRIIQDDVFARLLTFPNVIITSHEGFFTRDALTNIARTTIGNISAFESNAELNNQVTAEKHLA